MNFKLNWAANAWKNPSLQLVAEKGAWGLHLATRDLKVYVSISEPQTWSSEKEKQDKDLCVSHACVSTAGFCVDIV